MVKNDSTPATNEQKMRTGLWTPSWYEMDQSLVVGERLKYWFFQTPPESINEILRDGGETVDYVFFNQLDSSENCCARYARIIEMVHPGLGPLLRIDTDGLDYIFYPALGEEVVVNAEESPGTVCNWGNSEPIHDWSVYVKLTELSDVAGKLS